MKRALRVVHPSEGIDAAGYVASNWDDLLHGVRRADFEADLRAGRGGELRKNFRAAHSSAAPQVNAFAPFRQQVQDLRLLGMRALESLSFERQCPAGVSDDFAPPHLDALLQTPSGVVGVESKLCEYLRARKPGPWFSTAYDREIRDERRDSAWFREMLRIEDETHCYKRLDAPQLVKHAFGLAHTFRGGSATLVYLYWEPRNADDYSVFAEHRKEVDNLLGRVAGAVPVLHAVGYRALWDEWAQSGGWVGRHVVALRRRYVVAI